MKKDFALDSLSKSMPLKDAEDYIAETDQNFDEEIAEKSSESMLTVEGYYVSVPELGLRLRDGTIFTWRQNDYEPDLSVTVIIGAKKHTAKGMHCGGARVLLDSGKSVSVKKLEKTIHTGGYMPVR